MPNVSRPDLLPFAGAVTLGLPYHGLVKNGNAQADPAVPGTLYLPSGATRTYTQPYDGGCIMVQHPRHAALTRSSIEQGYDTAHDHQWIEYALLSGRLHQIGGQNLGQHYHLYCDADHAWKIRTELAGGTGTCTLKIYLNSLFGTFSDRSYAFTERLLATYTWTPETTSGTPITGSTVGDRYLATYSKTGAKVILNVGTTASISGLRHTIATQHNSSFTMHDAIRVTVAGNGLLTAGSIGTGIGATIEHVAWGDELYEVTTDSEGTAQDDYSWATTDYTDKYLFVTDKDGNETHIEFTYASYSQFWRITPFDPENPEGSDFALDCALTRTLSFGGTTLTATMSYDGYYVRPMSNSGTLTINGTDSEWSYDEYFGPLCPYDWAGEFTIDPVLPLVAIVVNENLSTRPLTAAGGNQVWTEDASQYYTYNPATGSVQVNANRICYV